MEQPDISYPVTDGDIMCFTKDSNTIYVGGEFSYIGPNTGHGIFIDSMGQLLPGSSRVEGKIMAAVPDGSGGLYIAGYFNRVGGLSRSRLAQIDSNGLVTAWNPNVAGNVFSMVVQGGIVYVAGQFTQIGGITRNNIGAVDGVTGAVTSFNPNANLTVNVIALSGNILYAGGFFTTIGGTTRNRIAAFNLFTGLLTGFNPGANDAVGSILPYNGKVYVGGAFFGIGLGIRTGVAELDSITGGITSFNASLSSGSSASVGAIVHNKLYISGSFTTVHGLPQAKLACINLNTGYATSWSPNPDGTTAIIVGLDSGRILLKGNFKHIAGTSKRGLAWLDTLTAAVYPSIDLPVDDMINCHIKMGSKIFMGGLFLSYGGVDRYNLAAFDHVTKQIKPFAPIIKRGGSNSWVRQVRISNGIVYLGGIFDSINGQCRNYCGAVDTSGITTSFNPNLNNEARKIIVNVGHIYLSGGFTTVGGLPRNSLVSFDESTGILDTWNPNPNGYVVDFEINDSTLYASGTFTTIGGAVRNKVAAIDKHTGLINSWNPNVTGTNVYNIEYGNGQVYIGGLFTMVGGQVRNNLASIDAFTGMVNGWAPIVDDQVNYEMRYKNNILYAQGDFNHVNSIALGSLAAIDGITGQPTSWIYKNSIYGPNGFGLDVIGSEVFVSAGDDFYYKNCVRGFYVLNSAKPFSHYVEGTLYNDSTDDCAKQLSEKGLSSIIVNSLPDNSFVISDTNGNYKMGFNDSIAYSMQPIIPKRLQNLLDAPCPLNYNINMTSLDPIDSLGYNFGMAGSFCPVLRVNISSGNRRRCRRGLTAITYINEGLADASGVTLHVKFPSFVLPLYSSDSSYTWDMTDTSMVFNIGTLQVGVSGQITIEDSVACDSTILGLTQCTKAWITPVNTCYNSLDSAAGSWDNSSLEVSGICIPGTGNVEFKIKNIGSGNMSGPRQYRIFSNNVMQAISNYTLVAGDSLLIVYSAAGATLRIETDQMPGHPGQHHPSFSIEGCRVSPYGYYSTGYIDNMPTDDDDLEIEISCLPIVDSYDPNLKSVSPQGIGPNHIVHPETLLDYRVNFQNTGTDTAYKVIVVDSLSPDLDISTLELGAYSYPYTLMVSGTGGPVLKFIFDGIDLTDSASDEFHSHGFFDFKIAPKLSIPIGTKIDNSASIFFDFNPSVTTNTAWVIIDTVVITPSYIASVISQPTIETSECQGDSVWLSASFSGQGLTYQWYKNTLLLPGKTDTILTFSSLSPVDTGNYSCKASGLLNSIQTNTIYLHCKLPPQTTTALLDISICKSLPLSFFIAATGDGLNYQWYQNGSVSPTLTSSIVNFSSILPTDAGVYYCYIWGACGTTYSDTMVLSVNNILPALAVGGIYDTAVCEGQLLSYTVNSSGDSLDYQWYFNSGLLLNDTLPGLTISSATLADAGNYFCVISNVCSSSNSDTAVVLVNDFVVPILNVSNDTIFSLGAYVSYQWFYNGALITGATNATYIFSLSGQYSVEVIDPNGCSGTSDLINVTLSINESLNESISLLPNPVSDHIIIEANGKQIDHVSIYTIEGKKIKEVDFKNTSMGRIEISDLSKGLYFVDCTSEGITRKYKLIKN